MTTLDLSDLNYLLPTTKNTLLSLAEFNWLRQFTFVGGSGLSLYLHHRLSEDIDLFTWEATLDKEKILPGIRKMFPGQIDIENDTSKQLDLRINKTQVTFFANDWDALKENIHFTKNLYVAKLSLLVGMKLNTLFLRAKFRDYYDLYALNLAGYKISQMYDIIYNIMPGINRRLFQMALTYTDDIEEDNILHLNPKYTVTKAEIREHFEELVFEWLRRI